MSLILFYDTETTGLPLFKEPSEHPDQPHIVQLAAALVDTDTRKTVSSIDVIIRPEGWAIPEEMTAIHGISTEYALDVGIYMSDAIKTFINLWNGRLRVGHNQSFDARMIRIAQHQFGYFTDEELDLWKNGEKFCTMYESKPYTQLPKNKHPKLQEAYMHFFGKEFDGAHSAMADVNACIAVYFAIKDLEISK
jgi:DNA polymerase-3 subunit epsilon